MESKNCAWQKIFESGFYLTEFNHSSDLEKN